MVIRLFTLVILSEIALTVMGVGPRSCSDIFCNSDAKYGCDGVYDIYPDGVNAKKAYCDMTTDGGGWTVIQRRLDDSVQFNLSWNAYKNGFGAPSGNHWLGNDDIYQITNSGPNFELRIDLKDWECNTRYAKYDSFNIGNEGSKYKLNVSGFNGDGGESLIAEHNGAKFSTYDQDNDEFKGQCAVMYIGAWWYHSCHYSNLNGYYYLSNPTPYAKGLVWYHWKGYYYSLKETRMMIRKK